MLVEAQLSAIREEIIEAKQDNLTTYKIGFL
jgi:hypothetical protein